MSEDPVPILLRRTTFRRIDVDNLLANHGNSWCRFDPELGYWPHSVIMQDGLDDSHSAYTYEPGGWRRHVHAADLPCRLNTYGDSFTQCQQVSDGETWQEVLAAHLREPVRNSGMGGYGVFQAYRRARRIEAVAHSPYVILNIYDDDHVRNLDAARWIRTAVDATPAPPDRPLMIHGLPWAHLRYDLDAGSFVEKSGCCPDADALRRLCDEQHFRAAFEHDEIVRLFLIERGADLPVDHYERLAEALQIRVDLRTPATRRQEARRFRREYGMRATNHTLDLLQAWFRAAGKQLLVVLSYGEGNIIAHLEGKPRFDQAFIDSLTQRGIPILDLCDVHARDFALYRLPPADYISRFYIPPTAAAVFGHYTPLANAWFAFALKPLLINWLNPKPPAYRTPDGPALELR